MKAAKQILTVPITVILLLFSTAVFAQTEQLRNSTPLQRAKLETFFMKKRLNLTQGQTSQVMKINLKYAQQMDPVIKGNPGKLVKMRQMTAIRRAKDNELTKVLSPGQYQAYLASREQMRQQMVEKMMQKRKGPG